jgi:hypothetical protein
MRARGEHFLPLLMIVLFAQGAMGGTDPRTGELVGTVIQTSNRQPIPSANIVLVRTTMGTASGIDGRFSLSGIPVGTYTVRISCVGFRTLNVTDVTIGTGRATQVNVALDEQPVELSDEVVSRGSYFAAPREITTSNYRMNYEEIRRSAGGLGDVSRLIQSMPGIVSPSDQRNDLVVRGGSPSENLTIVDNIEVPNLNHFAAQGASGGPIGMLNTEFINQADFLAGGFPAQYGNRLSSVLDVQLREGNRDRFSGDVDLGLAGVGGLLEGPIGKAGSWMAAARRSYLDLLAPAFGLTAVPHYSNYQAKVVYELNQEHKLWLVGLGGIDRIHFDVHPDDLDDPSLMDVESSGWRTITGVNWQWLWGKAGYGTLSISDALNEYHQDVYDEQFGNRQVFYNESKEGETTLKYDAAVEVKGLGQISTGVTGKFLRNTFTLRQPFGRRNPFSADSTRVDTTNIDGEYSTTVFGAYLQLARTLFEKLTVTAGIRYDRYAYLPVGRTSPRLGFAFEVMPEFTVSGSCGVFYQMPPLFLLYAVPSNAGLVPMRATHYVAGLSYLPSPDVKVSIEGYAKDYDDYPVSTEYPAFSLASTGDEYAVADRLIPMISTGSGKSRGMEFFVQKKLTQDLYGQISYSLSETRHKALDGVERDGGFDIPDVFSVVGGYRINEAWEISAKFTYAAGRPYTPPLEAESRAQNRYILDLTRVNAERSPAYHRLDIRADFRSYFSGWNLVAYVEVENVYNRKNIYQYVWNPKKRALDQLKQIGFFPFGGFKVEF